MPVVVFSFANLNHQSHLTHIELLFVGCWANTEQAITRLKREKEPEPTAHYWIFRPADCGLLDGLLGSYPWHRYMYFV